MENLPEEQKQLWERISHFELDEDGAAFAFSDRLARENGWPLAYALRAVEEYKKFMFLICVTDHPLTPSDQVDQVWHLHLLYTQSYWLDWCRDTLGKDIHHGPTKGGTDERNKFTDWYAVTQERYARIFGDMPPADLWPPSHIRFGELNFTRVNLHRNWIIPKPKIFRRWKPYRN